MDGTGPFGDGEGGFLPESGVALVGGGLPESGVTLVGGGPVSTRVLEDALRRAPRLVASDGGADACRARGLVPEVVAGDLDSLSPEARAALADRLVRDPGQDDTDFAKALRAAGSAPVVLGVGFLGGRLDHALAVLSHLAERPPAAPPVVLVSDDDAAALCPPRLALGCAPGDRVSLWPLGPARLRSEGLRWPLDGLTLDPAGRVGTSNAATGPVRLRCDGPCLVILDHARLDALLAGLAATRAVS